MVIPLSHGATHLSGAQVACDWLVVGGDVAMETVVWGAFVVVVLFVAVEDTAQK